MPVRYNVVDLVQDLLLKLQPDTRDHLYEDSNMSDIVIKVYGTANCYYTKRAFELCREYNVRYEPNPEAYYNPHDLEELTLDYQHHTYPIVLCQPDDQTPPVLIGGCSDLENFLKLRGHQTTPKSSCTVQ